MKLIDKDALVTEIEDLENIYRKCPTRNSYEEGLRNGRLIGYKDALYKINTLEVKEVDLEKEIEVWEYSFKHCPASMGYKETAKHFFEL